MFEGEMMYDGYSSRRRSRKKKEDMEHRDKLQKLQKRLNSLGGRIGMDETQFNDLFDLMINSSDQIVTDIFEQMLVAGKMVFGEEIGAIEIKRRKIREVERRRYEADILRHKAEEKRRDEAEKSLLNCEYVSKKIIAKRQKLLSGLTFPFKRTPYKTVNGTTKHHVDELLESGHLKVNWFGNIKVKSMDNIPTTKLMQRKIEKLRQIAEPDNWHWM